jgi:hypothetical protein
MGTIAAAMWERFENGDVDWIALARCLPDLLERKHLLVYVPDPTIRQIMAQRGWDGALRPGQGDFLAVIDANLGYNKASAKVEQEMVYQVDLREPEPEAHLTLVYTHTSEARVPCRPESRYASTYEGMMDRCYWDYIRVYVPTGCELLKATRIPLPGQVLWSGEPESGAVDVDTVEEAPCLSWGVMDVIPTGAVRTRDLTWTLPAGLVRWRGREGRYTLRVQKQPGKQAHPLEVRVRLPEQSRLVDAVPTPTATADGWVSYRRVLDRDLTFEVDLRREP